MIFEILLKFSKIVEKILHLEMTHYCITSLLTSILVPQNKESFASYAIIINECYICRILLNKYVNRLNTSTIHYCSNFSD